MKNLTQRTRNLALGAAIAIAIIHSTCLRAESPWIPPSQKKSPQTNHAQSLTGGTSDPFKDPLILEIIELHQKSEKGDKQATKDLVTKLENLVALHPENALILSYLGSAYTLASRDTFPGPTKYNYLKKGLMTMDKAVEDHPEEVSARFIRAVNNYHLPTFINRRDNARDDFKILVEAIEQDATLLSPETRQAIYYFAGLSFKQTKETEKAKDSLQKGIRELASSALVPSIEKELKSLH